MGPTGLNMHSLFRNLYNSNLLAIYFLWKFFIFFVFRR